jgi:hypothetical protein
LPTCNLSIDASTAQRSANAYVTITAAPTVPAVADLDLAPPHKKIVTGTVTDEEGLPAAGATVRVADDDTTLTTATTDSLGHYRIEVQSGDTLVASNDVLTGFADVSWTVDAAETIDLHMYTDDEGADCGDGEYDGEYEGDFVEDEPLHHDIDEAGDESAHEGEAQGE